MKIESMEEFIDESTLAVAQYFNDHSDKSDNISMNRDDVYCVWSVKALQNFKGLFSTPIPDGMYYEITYNGDKEEIYFDAYKKFDNKVIR